VKRCSHQPGNCFAAGKVRASAESLNSGCECRVHVVPERQ
jgi:hypothetical protein